MVLTDNIIKEYRVTEKATDLMGALNQYTFEVARSANKNQIAEAIERLFEVKVARVNVINVRGKTKRNRIVRGRVGNTRAIKKAIVTLKEGDKIELV